MFNFINERTSVRMASTLQTYSNDQRSTSCTHRERFISVSDILILSGPPELVSEGKNVLWPDEWTGDQKQKKKIAQGVSVLQKFQAILVRRSIRFSISSCAFLLLHQRNCTQRPQLPLIWLFDSAARCSVTCGLLKNLLVLVTP